MKANLNTYEITPSSQREVVKLTNEHDLIMSSNLNQIFRYTQGIQNELSEVQGANLLLSFASIVSKEIDEEEVDWEDDMRCSLPLSVVDKENLCIGRGNCNTDSDFTVRSKISITNIPHRIRTVSLDVCDVSQDGSINEVSLASSGSRLVSPADSPVISSINRRNPKRGAKMKSLTLNKRSEIPTKKSVEAKGKLNRPVETILRKKFSWKNYPELEAFLIANREEYLRHSALNYTVQQKQYNNKLTERLVELAAEHGYVFDEEAFSFVTVRDRIRCYFKSYVQSAKKRGVVIGYAARKAGLINDDDLEENVGKEGLIVLP